MSEKIGIFTRKNYRKSGIEIFEQNTVDWLAENIENAEKVEYTRPTWFPLSITLHNLTVGRRLRKKADKFDKVFILSQDRMMFDPESVEAEVLVYVHDIIPATSMYKKYDNSSFTQRLRGYPSTVTATRYMKFLAKCDKIITASNVTAQELQNRTAFDGETVNVYQGVDHFPEVESKERDIDLIYVGSTLHRKNPELLKEVMRKAQENGYSVHWVNYFDIDLPGTGHVNVSDEELAELYSRSRFYLHPSLAEGFGRGAVEAQKNGAVPLALDKPINHEVLGEEDEAWFEIEDYEDVKQKLIWEERGILEKARIKAKENAGRFQWSRTRKELKEVLTK